MFFSFFSDSAAYPELESDIDSWESFLSDVRKEIEKAEVSCKTFYNSVKMYMMVIIPKWLESDGNCYFFELLKAIYIFC